MSLSNATEVDILDVLLRGLDPSYRAGATQYLALFTADPSETGSISDEADYTGYARVALTKSSAWTGASSPYTNAGLIQFGQCTSGSNVLTHFAVVDTASGAVNMMITGAMFSALSVSAGIQPQFSPGVLQFSAD